MYVGCMVNSNMAVFSSFCCGSLNLFLPRWLNDGSITQIHRGFWTLSIVWNSKQLGNTKFRKLDLILSSGEGKEPLTLLVPLITGPVTAE
jgi:hypothetical protein